MHIKALGGIACVVLLGACAQVPRPSTYPYSLQQQMQAAEHWQALAVKMVESLPSRSEPVYLPPEDDSLFGQALRSLLKTELTKQGIEVSVDCLYGFERFILQSHRSCSLHGSPRHSGHRWRPAARREVVTSHGP
jgi:hypothetical protein